MTDLPQNTRRQRIDEPPPLDGADLWPDQTIISNTFLEYEQERSQNPNDPEIYFRFGMRFLEFGPGEELEAHAIAAFQRCTELDPKNANAFYHLGFALSQSHRYDEALKAYEQALELEPNSPDIILGLVYANLALNDAGMATAWVHRLIDIDHSNADGLVLDKRIFYCWYGIILILNDRWEEAESYFLQTLDAEGETLSIFTDAAHYGLGAIYINRGESATRELLAVRNRNTRLYRSLLKGSTSGEIDAQEILSALTGREPETS